jgi:hypothetical protein
MTPAGTSQEQDDMLLMKVPVLFCLLQTLRCARVVGMTTSGVARMQALVEALQPKVGPALTAVLDCSFDCVACLRSEQQ